ncbi:hemerythrin-like metal-binding protein [Sulfuricella denitrificans skB26]|uniref:Hemerythrin-like metal-binding protein n=1 Tax=Sulfuricella denitrificans (strain DSM 22764 / NBRC 105220 / skB26) TaxID=1163617 RepID=S6AZC9_SULDS|nr:bacteriohemerythrin [Sulfuricella denitrificans]BAN33872.1 hemerythrin-like metal-binding protein [Sulfuricella denitrificans skB26]
MADAVPWKKEYSVNDPELDEQHKLLIQMINDLHGVIVKKHDPGTVCEVLARLIHYTRTHFEEEEALMRNSDFPGYEAHKARHEQFINEVEALKRRAKMSHGSEQLVGMEMLFKLKDWLVDHIVVMDMDYSRHVQSRSAVRGTVKSWLGKFG